MLPVMSGGMEEQCLAVFTTETPVRILRQGGTRGWRVNPDRASTVPFLVCVHNHAQPAGRVPGSVPLHRGAFLVARINGVVPAAGDNRPHRWKICISAFYRLNVPDAWRRWPNPVKYTSLEKLGIDFATIDFHDLEEAQFHIGRLTARKIGREEAKRLLF
jgi:hypothetical protein